MTPQRAFTPRLGESLYAEALGTEWVEVEPGIFVQREDLGPAEPMLVVLRGDES